VGPLYLTGPPDAKERDTEVIKNKEKEEKIN
jgi:predicted small lipoprotein YifL